MFNICLPLSVAPHYSPVTRRSSPGAAKIFSVHGPEATLMVRRQQVFVPRYGDGPEATLMIRRQQVFVPCYSDGPEATYDGSMAHTG